MRIDINGVSINVISEGRGRPLFLLHGYGGSVAYWQDVIEPLSRSYRVIAYDQRGFGESGKPQAGYLIPDYVEDQRRLMLELEASPAYILGFSQGGAVALHFTAAHPEMSLGLVMNGASTDFARPGPETVEQSRKLRQGLIDLIRVAGISGYADRFTAGALSPGFRERNPAGWKRYYDMLLRNDPEAILRIAGENVSSLPVIPDFRRVKCPVLFIQGELDSLIPPEKRRRAEESIPGSRTVVIPGVGHASAAEAPDVFIGELTAFLNRCDSTSGKL
jgi:pimeloyl-ACP methyl ester carboxylesterase